MGSQRLSAYFDGLASRLIDDTGVKRKIIGLINGYGGGGSSSTPGYANLAAFPVTGSTDKLYLAEDTGTVYYWNGSTYIATAGGGTAPAEVYYLSTIVGASTADLSMYSTSLGADKTAAIQAVLDNAQNGPILVIWDGAYSVTGLEVWGNTTIHAPSLAFGAIMRHSADRSLFTNKHVNLLDTNTHTDKNIQIIGGTWNGYGYNSDGTTSNIKGNGTVGMNCIMRFYGCENILVRDTRMLNPACYISHMVNTNYFMFDNNHIDVGDAAAINADGLHADGNCNYGTFQNNWLKTWDDKIALNADDLWNNTGSIVYPYYLNIGGPVSNIDILNNTAAGGLFGIRLLSAGSLLSNITIDGFHGFCKGYAVILDCFTGTGIDKAGAGNLKNIRVSNITVDVTRDVSFPTDNHIIKINANVSQLVVENISGSIDSAFDGSTILYKGGNIDKLTIRGMHATFSSAQNANVYTQQAGTEISFLQISDLTIEAAGTTGVHQVLQLDTGATIDSLAMSNISTYQMNRIVNNAGTIAIQRAMGITFFAGVNAAFTTSSTIDTFSLSNYVSRFGGTKYSGTYTNLSGDATP